MILRNFQRSSSSCLIFFTSFSCCFVKRNFNTKIWNTINYLPNYLLHPECLLSYVYQIFLINLFQKKRTLVNLLIKNFFFFHLSRLNIFEYIQNIFSFLEEIILINGQFFFSNFSRILARNNISTSA